MHSENLLRTRTVFQAYFDSKFPKRLAFPKGTKDRYKAYAEFCGKSLTALFQELIEREIENDFDYDEDAYLKEYMERKG